MSIRREKEEYIQSKNNMIIAIYVSLDNVTGPVSCVVFFIYLFLPKQNTSRRWQALTILKLSFFDR
jgi:hypothetical protein